MVQQPNSGAGHPIVEVPRSHTTRQRQPVELLSTNNDLVAEAAIYTTHNKHKRRTSITLAVFEPAIPAIRRLDTYAWGATTTEIGSFARYFWSTLTNKRQLKYYKPIVLSCAVAQRYYFPVLGGLAKLCKATVILVVFVCPFVRPSILPPAAHSAEWNNSAPTERIFMKFVIWVFFENLSRKFDFL